MTSPGVDFESLITVHTVEQHFARALEIAAEKNLPVTTWRDGDPMLVLLYCVAELNATRDQMIADFIKGGILSQATGDWATVNASEVYGTDREGATYAAPTVTVQNTGGGFYPVVAGDLTFKSSISDATFRNTDAATLSAGVTHTFELIADAPGSASSVAVNEVDTLVTTRLGVVVLSSTAAIGVNEQSTASLKEQAGDTLGALSPNGPADAYEAVARNVKLTTAPGVTRAKSTLDSAVGDVTIYLGGPSGGVTAPEVAKVQAALLVWATPIGMHPTAVSATASPQAITAAVTGTGIPGSFAANAAIDLGRVIAALPLGGAMLARSAIIASLQSTAERLGATGVSVSLSAPAADVTIGAANVATLGTVTIT